MERRNLKVAGRNLWIGAGVALALVLISSCGGGGGGGGPSSSNPPPPPPTGFSYPSSYYAYTAGPAVGDFEQLDTVISSRSNDGGTWSISPALPAGLVLNPANGTIGGQPTAASPATQYTVTNVTTSGTYDATLTIAVAAAPLMNLGLTNPVTSIKFVNSSVLSVETPDLDEFPPNGWVLQDFASGAILASSNGIGASAQNVLRQFTDLEGNVMVDLTAAGLEVRSAMDGSVISTIPEPLTIHWYRLATDGSYIAAGSPTALTIWSTTGTVLVSRSGNYATANAYAAPGQILIANGPAGANVIETDSVPTGSSSVSPVFMGTFNSWFDDGQRFVTNLGTTVWIYSNLAVQQDFTTVSTGGSIFGQGDWFWTFDGQTGTGQCGFDGCSGTGELDIYQVGASTSPTFSATYGQYAFAVPSGGTIGVGEILGVSGNPTAQIAVIDLSGPTPTSATYTVPYGPFTYGAQSATAWLTGDVNGVIFDGTSLAGQPRTLTLGAATSIAGGTSYFSIATASGTIFNYNSSDNSLAGTISFPVPKYSSFPGSNLWASADGTVLVAMGSDGSARVYSLPSGALLSTISSNPSFTALSQSGAVIAEGAGSGQCTQFVPAAGGAPLYCVVTGGGGMFAMSPDGTQVAVDGGGPSAQIFRNGTLVTAVPGWAFIWLDNDRLLTYQSLTKFQIYDSTGNFLSDAATQPNLSQCYSNCQIVSADSLTQGDEIVNFMTGAITWESGDYLQTAGVYLQAGKGIAAGSQMVFLAGDFVLAEPFPTN
jgi:hypothetical protein